MSADSSPPSQRAPGLGHAMDGLGVHFEVLSNASKPYPAGS
jgi:hypothetical protein